MGTTKVVYVGHNPEGVLIAESGQWAATGEAVEVESELADRLLEQATFARPSTKDAKEAARQSRAHAGTDTEES